MHDLMSVAEVARLLNVTPQYVVERLLRTHVLRPVFRIHGRRYVVRSKAEAYYHRRRRIGRRALGELARVSQEAGLYEMRDHSGGTAMSRNESMDDDYAADIAREILNALAVEVPDDFPRDAMPGAAPGVQIKLEGVLAEERYERWLVCEDLAQQLVPVAKKDEAAHPEHRTEQTLERVCAAVASKAWVSPKELDWLMQRLRTLLELD
jgi:hypothetical protein